jgi:hypothetical protein
MISGVNLLGGTGGQLTRELRLRPEEVPYVLRGESRDDEAWHQADKALAPKGEQNGPECCPTEGSATRSSLPGARRTGVHTVIPGPARRDGVDARCQDRIGKLRRFLRWVRA